MDINFNKIKTIGNILISFKNNSWVILIILLLLSALIPIWILTKQTQIITGDEPRYLLYAISLWEKHIPVLSQADYDLALAHLGEAAAKSLPSYKIATPKPSHSIIYPVIMSAAVGQLGALGGRLISLAIGLGGFVGLFLLLYQISKTKTQTFCFTLLIAITFPVLPYLSLALPEIALFTGTAWVFYLFGQSNDDRSPIFIALLLVILAFIHLRAVGLVISIPIIFLIRQIDEYGYQHWDIWRSFIIFILILITGLALLSIFNLSIYDSLLGSVTTARPKFSDLGMANALIGARHGLLTYAPVYIMGIVGLILGCLRGNIWAIRSSTVLSFLIVGFIGPDAGECWPARFWVITVPALTIGLLLAWQYSSYAGRTLFIILILISLLNTLTYSIYPNMYLENRQISRVYEYWHEKAPAFHFGTLFVIANQPWQGQALLFLILIGAAIQSISQKYLHIRWAFVVLFLIGFLGTALVEPVDTEIYDKGNDYVNIQLKNTPISNSVFLLELYKPWLYFQTQTTIHINNTLILAAPSLLLDLYGRPELKLVFPPATNNLHRSTIVLLRVRAPWIRWLGIGNQVWHP